MRSAALLEPHPDSPRLRRRHELPHDTFWTLGAAGEAPVYGERLLVRPEGTLRHFEPGRSKLAAALARGLARPLPRPGERWLYLGAATGTTASHVADLVGPTGRVYAVEKSLRPFARLLALAQRYPNLCPILGDARWTDRHLGLIPPVAGVYADLAQPDQVAIVLGNCREFLRPDGHLLLALKTASMGRASTPEQHARAALRELAPAFELADPIPLDPFHRRHYLIAGRATPGRRAGAPSTPANPLRPSPRRPPLRRAADGHRRP
ncbi:MAG: fibrillarin-like rRNA/tRNA 2'-O-methyltransferase [Thermoplasmata archaeon]